MVRKVNSYWICEECGMRYVDKKWADKSDME